MASKALTSLLPQYQHFCTKFSLDYLILRIIHIIYNRAAEFKQYSKNYKIGQKGEMSFSKISKLKNDGTLVFLCYNQ